MLRRIVESGSIFCAWSDRTWVLDGAAVRVAIVCFGKKSKEPPVLDGASVQEIHTDLSSDTDVASGLSLPENAGIAFMGDTKGGLFDIEPSEARSLLALPNPNGRNNAEVLRPWINGGDLTKRSRAMWIIDFGCGRTETDASGFERPFGIVEERVKPDRVRNRRESYAKVWWQHVEPRPALRKAMEPHARFLATPRVAKHRLFTWFPAATLPDSRLFVFAASSDYIFGVLHSSIHELWSLRACSWHGVGNDPAYNTTTCFETFPLPWPPGKEKTSHPAYKAIAAAAKDLDTQRERWLNPPEYLVPIAARIDAADDFADVPAPARPLIRHSAIMAAAAADPKLKKRTLTNLYNERPTWLRLAHEKLDRAVLSAYAAVDPKGAWQEDWAEVWIESGAGQPLPKGHALIAKRAEVEEKLLASLLRLNTQRA